MNKWVSKSINEWAGRWISHWMGSTFWQPARLDRTISFVHVRARVCGGGQRRRRLRDGRAVLVDELEQRAVVSGVSEGQIFESVGVKLHSDPLRVDADSLHHSAGLRAHSHTPTTRDESGSNVSALPHQPIVANVRLL